ncbi:MAG: hypothetical protein ACYCYQ_15250 [Acidimicrobiales bacterium]
MSMPPVGWIIEQQLLAEDRERLDTSFLLLLSGAGQVGSGMLKERQEGQAVYATLVLGRVRFDAVEVTIDGEIKHLEEPEAKSYFKEQIADPAIREHETAEGNVARQRDEFVTSAVVSKSVEVVKPVGRFRKETVLVDVVEFKGRRFERPPGSGRHFVQAEAEKRFPNLPPPDRPDFLAWWINSKEEVRTWQALLFTAEDELPVEFTVSAWTWGYPTKGVLKLLDQLSSDGWNLVHVSEDRGLYTGADALNESYPTRARYLLEKRASGLL